MVAKKNNNVSKVNDERKLLAFLATFLGMAGAVIAIIAKKDDDYVMFYAKQSIVISIFAMACGIISFLLIMIPSFGFIIAGIIWLFIAVLWMFSCIYSLSGQKRETPLVGSSAKYLNFN